MSQLFLLCIDDEPQILRALERNLRGEEYTVLATTHIDEALEWAQQNEIQVVLSDYRMREMTGLEVLNQIKKMSPQTIRVILSGYADEVTIKNALQNGDVHDFLPKPWEVPSLKENIRKYFKKYLDSKGGIRIVHK